ncbi:MAG TPA: OmpA family protein [Terriglobales bacterium]|nr:OmpA family protein [Terriglobales bacterium]
MERNRLTIVASLMALFLSASVASFGAGGDKTKTKGTIMARTGETLIVKSGAGNTTVVLTDDTRTKDDRGLFGLEKQTLSSVVLIPGLKLEVEGVSDDQGRVVAKTITVDGDDLEAAEMIQSGLHPTAEQVAANVQTLEAHQQELSGHKMQLAAQKEGIESNQQNIASNKERIEQNIKDIEENSQRFSALTDYDVKGQATVKFKVSSSKISPEDQEQLKQLAQTATGLTGYIVEVMGYADATGGAEMNTKLSEERAKAVITYLVQQGNVPIRHVVAPGAMGEYGAAAPNETKAGRAENRRVEVKVLVNKGIAGS